MTSAMSGLTVVAYFVDNNLIILGLYARLCLAPVIGHDFFGLHPFLLFLRGPMMLARVSYAVAVKPVSLACSPTAKKLACDVLCLPGQDQL
jgi:hypothetical protein